MSENKKAFTEAMSTAMVIDQDRNNVLKVTYQKNIAGYEEVVRIDFTGGICKLITVDGNSNKAIAEEILHGIYGPEATGMFFCGFEENLEKVLRLKTTGKARNQNV